MALRGFTSKAWLMCYIQIVQRMNNSSNAKADSLYVGFGYVIIHYVSSWIFTEEVTGEKILS